ncbi:DsbA family protein [Pseudomonas fluorescens]|uniref:DSBA oxidoreductase n=1 Tax=Pseudomonas fluorescens TaxID=294 RepID=A0AAE2A823_PSEFL|nr:DsbA family protein [Pseudomonas fluorescens]KIF60406.1 DSBA oxidoreductase [Pseudomonas fluorescens]
MASLKVPVSANDHRQGSAHAKVTLVEFGDYECPYCGLAYWVVKNLQQRFHNDLLFVFRNFPLTTAHPHAMGAAVTAEYAGSRGLFWEAHDELYENQDRLGMPLFRAIALKHGLSSEELYVALQEGTYLAKIKSDFNGGVRSGVNGTPAFYIDGLRYDGVPEFAEMSQMIERSLVS